MKKFLSSNDHDLKDFITLENSLSSIVDFVCKILSLDIILNEKENNDILKLIKEFVYSYLIEVAYFNKNINNMKLFDLLINELDDWYVKQVKNEIYIFIEKIIF